jgi:hypothetical protein
MGELTILRPGEARLPAPLRTALEKARADLQPISPKALAVKLEQTLAIWPLPENFQQTAQFYREALADVPADLVDKALSHVRLTSKWFPKPAELREPIRDALAARRRILGEAQRDAREYVPPVKGAPPTPEQFAEVKRIVNASIKRIDADPIDFI